jgi:hypothetical protein
MFDIVTGATAPPYFSIRDLEFLRVAISPALDGCIFVALTATTADDEERQLIEQEIASGRVATIDAAVRVHRRARAPCVSFCNRGELTVASNQLAAMQDYSVVKLATAWANAY